jgi:ribosome-binding factor A
MVRKRSTRGGDASQRPERLGVEIRAVLAEVIARGAVRDSRVRDAGIVTITWVRVTGDLSEARVAFTVFGADVKVLDRVRAGLEAARAFFQQELARRLRTRKTVMLSFEIDRTLDNSFRVDTLLREDAALHGGSARSIAPEVSGAPSDPDAAHPNRVQSDSDEDEGAARREGPGDAGDPAGVLPAK